VKRVLLIVSTLFVVIALAIAIFWLRWTGDQRQPESRFVSAVVELGLSLQAPDGAADPESPIFVSISLASPRVINLTARGERDALDDLPNLTMGSARSPWWSGIQLVARSGDDEQDLPWTPLPGGAEPIADLMDGFGRSVRGVVSPGELDLAGSLQLEATMQWKNETIGSNVVDLEVNPDGVDVITNATLLANYHLEIGNLDEARRWAEELVGLQPREPNVYALRARILEEVGDLAEAQRSWVQAIELLPENLEEVPTIYFENLRAVEARLASVDARGRSR
jgi:tetratricopeptide (TPR) repeat protein